MSTDNFNQLYLDDNIFSEIVKELYNLYNKERLKGKNEEQILNICDQFLAKKNQNSDNVIKWCLENQFNSMAQIILARCYQYGKWIEKDEHKAFTYYQKSADMELDEGMFCVGVCYLQGIGVKKDEHKACIYFQNAAEMGHAGGTVNIGYRYKSGTGVEKDEKKAFEYFKKAADMGHVTGILQVGNCYRNGIGVPRDIQRANHWYRKERAVKRINKSSYEDIEDIDDNLKKILEEEKYQLSWIPYNEFGYIQEIGRGGFATVYYAYWLNKNTNTWISIALKLIHGSNKCNQEFISELKQYCEIGYDNPSFLKCHGVSRDDKSNDYIIVLDYASKGSLRQNLPDVAQMAWKDKLNVLYSIVSDLESIHSQELIHRDLHSGNILQDHLHSAYITDLGLTVSSDIKKKEIVGIVPYVTPEVLIGEECTQAADIYSFGVIMSEISTGRRAFDGESFDDTKFVKRICQGKRPEFDKKTPGCYVKLAKRCMDKNRNKRPTATDIAHKIGHWLDEMKQDDDNEIKKQFLEADKIKPNIELPKHPNHMYTSKRIKTGEIRNS